MCVCAHRVCAIAKASMKRPHASAGATQQQPLCRAQCHQHWHSHGPTKPAPNQTNELRTRTASRDTMQATPGLRNVKPALQRPRRSAAGHATTAARPRNKLRPHGLLRATKRQRQSPQAAPPTCSPSLFACGTLVQHGRCQTQLHACCTGCLSRGCRGCTARDS